MTGPGPTIYLDSNATTRPADEVVAAMTEALTGCWHNPSSIHRPGQGARQKLELARKEVAGLIGTKPRFITFTGSGTEALDLAVRGTLGMTTRRTIVTTQVEHGALRGLCRSLASHGGCQVRHVGLGAGGVVDTRSLESLIDDSVALVSIQWANNETGAIHPIDAIGEICRRKGVTFHCDGTQWVGKMPTNVEAGTEAGAGAAGGGGVNGAAGHTGADQHTSVQATWGGSGRFIDILTFSPHKFHGPKGVGVVYLRQGVKLAPVIHGEQELGRRGGTENVPGILGAGAAARLAKQWLADPARMAAMEALRDRFEQSLVRAVPDAVLNGPPDRRQRLWNTSNVAFPRLESEALLLLLSERGVCASAGSACSSGSLEPSPVLLACGVPPERAHGSLRFSLCRETSAEEIDHAVRIVAECVDRLKKSMVTA
ncbi:MAG: aminotransferase class V-fold PLP-dependent enzyme [Phycisphaeraceae bacterium]|nr:aminotransferase class V-fold PLP-dependent enzyme [Phycisphaeraceae bacterium]